MSCLVEEAGEGGGVNHKINVGTNRSSPLGKLGWGDSNANLANGANLGWGGDLKSEMID